MSGAAIPTPGAEAPIPEFKQVLGHPQPAVDAVHDRVLGALRVLRHPLGAGAVHRRAVPRRRRRPARRRPTCTYGSYLALVYAGAIFGGYVADRVIGYQRSILLGAVIMAAGLFMITLPDPSIFKFGLATIIVGNGLFKPNISTMVGKLYAPGRSRAATAASPSSTWASTPARSSRRSSPAGWPTQVFGTDVACRPTRSCSSPPASACWSAWCGSGSAAASCRASAAAGRGAEASTRVLYVAIGALLAIPLIYFLLALGADVAAVGADRDVRRPGRACCWSKASATARWRATR